MTDRRTLLLTIALLGAAALGGMLATYLLAQRVLDQSAGAGTVDAAAVGIVAIPAGFTTTTLGFLGGMLASTRSTPNKAEIDEALAPLTTRTPLPVVVNNSEHEPAHVDVVQPDRAAAHPVVPEPPPA